MLTIVFVLKDLTGVDVHFKEINPLVMTCSLLFNVDVTYSKSECWGEGGIWNLTECVSEHQTNQTYWRHFHNSYEWRCYILWWWCWWWWIYFCIWWYLGEGAATHSQTQIYREVAVKNICKDFWGDKYSIFMWASCGKITDLQNTQNRQIFHIYRLDP